MATEPSFYLCRAHVCLLSVMGQSGAGSPTMNLSCSLGTNSVPQIPTTPWNPGSGGSYLSPTWRHKLQVVHLAGMEEFAVVKCLEEREFAKFPSGHHKN